MPFDDTQETTADSRVSDIDEGLNDGQQGDDTADEDEDLTLCSTNEIKSNDLPGISLSMQNGEYVPRHTFGKTQVYVFCNPVKDKTITMREVEEWESLTEEASGHILFGNPKRKAATWSHFEEGISVNAPYKAKVICRWCGSILSHPCSTKSAKSGMSTLKVHAQTCEYHSKTQGRQASLQDFMSSDTRQAAGFVYTKEKLYKVQLALAVALNVPFTTFDSPQLHEFLDLWKRSPQNAIAAATIANRRQLASFLHRSITDVREEQARDLSANVSRISISLDGWTSPNALPYVGIVAHYIDNKFVLRRETLAFDVITGSHTGETYADLVWEILRNRKLLDKV